MRFFNLLSVFLLSLGINSWAEDTPQHWKGEGELGYTLTSGNSDNETIVSKLSISYQQNSWINTFKIESLRTESKDSDSSDTVVTANRITLSDKLSYDISEHIYSFFNTRYEEDNFSGFEYQSSATLGAGYRVIKQQDISLTLESGVGYQQDRTDDRQMQKGRALRFSEDFAYQITSTTNLTQGLIVEQGKNNVYSEFNAGFKVAINGSLALKLSHLIKHNSDVPDDKENFDRVTTATLVYGF